MLEILPTHAYVVNCDNTRGIWAERGCRKSPNSLLISGVPARKLPRHPSPILPCPMARYKPVDTSPLLLPVILEQQLQPGTFEHALNHLIDHEMPDELAAFDRHYCNDQTGAPAYAPAVLLKVILFAYSRGMVSSRDIARACREHVTFIALSGDSQPHFTTLAAFIRQLGADIARLFARILWLCDRQGLIGRQMFAIDGVKLPSNAAKHRSGTRADFERQAQKLEAAITAMMDRHRQEDAEGESAQDRRRSQERKKTERLRKEAAALRQWLAAHPDDKTGARGSIRKSNRTDNDSAKMATDKGVLQGTPASPPWMTNSRLSSMRKLGAAVRNKALLSPLPAVCRPTNCCDGTASSRPTPATTARTTCGSWLT